VAQTKTLLLRKIPDIVKSLQVKDSDSAGQLQDFALSLCSAVRKRGNMGDPASVTTMLRPMLKEIFKLSMFPPEDVERIVENLLKSIKLRLVHRTEVADISTLDSLTVGEREAIGQEKGAPPRLAAKVNSTSEKLFAEQQMIREKLKVTKERQEARAKRNLIPKIWYLILYRFGGG
jgi:hypothetical protein